MKPKTINIDQLRCKRLAGSNETFDMLRYEDFARDNDISNQVHRHNYYMVFFCTGGYGKQLIDFESYDISKGMIFTMYPGQIHAWQEGHNLTGFLIFFTDAFFNMRYHNNILLDFPFFNTGSFKPFTIISAAMHQHKEALFNCMLSEFNRRQADYLKVLRSYLNVILIETKRIFEIDSQKKEQKDKNAFLIVNNFERLINEHFKSYHKVRDYAELLLLTPNYLNAVSQKILGRSAGELIRNRIMLEAKRLLLHENLTVAEIGTELGFEDNSYFCRFFKKYEHTSPQKFRKNYLNGTEY